MTTQTQKLLDEIERKFIEIATHVKFQNKKNRTDINDDMERFFKQVLNAHHGYELKTTNDIISNYPAIDLRDDDERICYQITSTNTTAKIKKTIQTFKDKKLYNEFDKLVFLILTDQDTCSIIDPSPNQPMATDVSIMSLTDLDYQISKTNNETKIRKIHRLAHEEYRPAVGTSGYLIKGPAQVHFESMQRLIDQAGFDKKKEAEDIRTYEKDFTAFVKKLAELEVEERAVLQRLVVKSELVPHSHTWLYIPTARVAVQFKNEETIVDSLKQYFWSISEDLTIDDSFPFNAISLNSFTKLDLNIFAELKLFAENDDDLLREMIVSLDFNCLAY
ncbi:SMEK domain-containing protein [Pseudomonas ficuserectae]|uniref:SMEK domain-containing protein n=1 Tax=Pseudomonas ficuserectae TaxID=53410 RepID=UPI0006D5E998|nr:SMEK domain-containing protein [Pseudomonas ficuserectae]